MADRELKYNSIALTDDLQAEIAARIEKVQHAVTVIHQLALDERDFRRETVGVLALALEELQRIGDIVVELKVTDRPGPNAEPAPPAPSRPTLAVDNTH
jgi:hypothetical protein